MTCRFPFWRTYESVKLLQIRSIPLGIFNLLFTLAILVYLTFYVFYYAKQYQITDIGRSSVMSTLKVVGLSAKVIIRNGSSRLFDTVDLVVPGLDKSALFLTTNLIFTPKQSLTECSVEPNTPNSLCVSDDDCETDTINNLSPGINTGLCLKGPNESFGTCQINAWCPLEKDVLPLDGKQILFPSVQNASLMLKNYMKFQHFNIHRRNILPWMTDAYLDSCRYNASDERDKYCPVFQLKTIFDAIDANESLLIKGGVIGIDINWQCDFDRDPDQCLPEYAFYQLSDSRAHFARGFNFRYAYYYRENGVLYRDLVKAYGINFIINAHGVAGKFHFTEFTMNFGSALGLLGLVTRVCDFATFCLLPKRNLYATAIVEPIETTSFEEQTEDNNQAENRCFNCC